MRNLFLSLLLVAGHAFGQVAPVAYYTFDETNPLDPVGGGTALSGGGVYSIETLGGIVGKFMRWDTYGSADLLVGPIINTGFDATIEFWWRAGRHFDDVRNSTLASWAPTMTLTAGYPYITFGSPGNDLRIFMNGIGRRSWDYWLDNQWHHIAMVLDGNTGRKELWIDGQCPPQFQISVTPGAINLNKTYFGGTVGYTAFYGDVDEIAFYTSALSGDQIYANYLEGLAGNHYTESLQPYPAPDPTDAGINPDEYAPDHPTYGTVTQVEQLDSFPLPRYAWNHTLNRNFNWGGIEYFAGYLQPTMTSTQLATDYKSIETELVTNWNYMMSLAIGATVDLYDTSYTLANNNPSWPLSLITRRFGLPTVLRSQALPSFNYLQNGSGQFLDANGNVSTTGKYWSPEAPVSTYYSDGDNELTMIQAYGTKLTRPIDFINDDDEIFTVYQDAAIDNDPAVSAAQVASGLDQQDYLASQIANNDTLAFRDRFMSDPTISGTAKYTEYKIDGHRSYQFRYEYKRKTMTPFGSHYYSTTDFYPRYPSNWRTWSGPWHGLQWIAEARKYEYAISDSLYSPFVAPGWDQFDATKNIRPAQWLGLLKVIASFGADFFYTGYFNEAPSYTPPNPPPSNPAGYAWQFTTPSYAQAIASRYESYLTDGDIVQGDYPTDYAAPVDSFYCFYAGQTNKIVTVRKLRADDEYVITGTIQPISNEDGNAPLVDTALIILDGDSLQFQIRRQGSVYIYDNSSPSDPVFYQLDGWHEATHPYYWTDDFNFEAENYDSVLTATITKASVRPDLESWDWTDFTTHIEFSGAGAVNYLFQPRKERTYYAFARARSSDGTDVDLTFSVDGAGSSAVECINDTSWQWYSYASATGELTQYTPTADTNHWLTIAASSNKLQVDAITLSLDSTLYTPVVTTCASATATITASGSTSFCSGGSVTLSANTGSSYLWSTGATTKSIDVTTSGSYVVTVTTTGVGTATSAPTVVTVWSLPTANITYTGSTNLCAGDSVILTVTAATSYLWNTGATTQSIAVYAATTYGVTVTDANGCTKVSAGVPVTNAGDPGSTLTAFGSTTFCEGGQVILNILTNDATATWQWRRNGTVVPGAGDIYIASQAGIYDVMVTTAGGCTQASNAIDVTVDPSPTQADAGPDQSICVDSTWLGGNTAIIGTGAWTLLSGTATIEDVSNPNTKITSVAVGTSAFKWEITSGLCTPTSDTVNITREASSALSIAISASATTFCSGDSVTIMAAAANAENFQWVLNGSNVGTDTNTYAKVFSDGDSVWCVATSSIGCVSGSPATSDTIILTEGVTPSASITAASSTTFCEGGSVRLDASTGSGYTYQWKNSGGNILGETDTSYIATTSETYSVVIVSSDNCSATSAGTSVTVNSKPTADITVGGSTQICTGDSVQLTSTTATSYSWSTGETTQSVYVADSNSYRVTVTNGSGCTASSGTVNITEVSSAQASVTPSGQQLCSGYTTVLNASSGSSYVWSTGATDDSITVATGGVYTVTVADANGCTSSASSTVTLVNCGDCPPPDQFTSRGYAVGVNLDWNDVAGATAYTVQLVNEAAQDTTEITFNRSRAKIVHLTRNTSYSYVVKSYCGSVTGISVWSRRQYVRTR